MYEYTHSQCTLILTSLLAKGQYFFEHLVFPNQIKDDFTWPAVKLLLAFTPAIGVVNWSGSFVVYSFLFNSTYLCESVITNSCAIFQSYRKAMARSVLQEFTLSLGIFSGLCIRMVSGR